MLEVKQPDRGFKARIINLGPEFCSRLCSPKPEQEVMLSLTGECHISYPAPGQLITPPLPYGSWPPSREPASLPPLLLDIGAPGSPIFLEVHTCQRYIRALMETQDVLWDLKTDFASNSTLPDN